MKKIIFTAIFFCFVSISSAQMATYDASVSASVKAANVKSASFFSKSLAEAAKQFEKLKELKENFEEQSKLVRVVNSGIANGKQMVRIKNNLSAITKEYSAGINYLKNEPSIDLRSKTEIMKGYGRKLTESLDYFEDASNFISDSFQMNDAERIKMLIETNEKLEFQRGFIIYLNNKVKHTVVMNRNRKSNLDFIVKETKAINKN